MQAEVYVQGQFYKVVETEFTHQLLNQVISDIEAGLVPHFNSAQPHMIEIKNIQTTDPGADALTEG
jgi:hypothetical protein